ncbi:MAG: hypothetical protein IPI48_18850 [bacterium]|nr:hypothetical protein [bacterium]
MTMTAPRQRHVGSRSQPVLVGDWFRELLFGVYLYDIGTATVTTVASGETMRVQLHVQTGLAVEDCRIRISF